MRRQTFAPPVAPPGFEIEHVCLEVDTYPLRGRVLAWVLYRTPLKFIARHIKRSPYTKVVMVLRAAGSDRVTREKDLPASDAQGNTPVGDSDA